MLAEQLKICISFLFFVWLLNISAESFWKKSLLFNSEGQNTKIQIKMFKNRYERKVTDLKFLSKARKWTLRWGLFCQTVQGKRMNVLKMRHYWAHMQTDSFPWKLGKLHLLMKTMWQGWTRRKRLVTGAWVGIVCHTAISMTTDAWLGSFIDISIVYQLRLHCTHKVKLRSGNMVTSLLQNI